MVSTPTYLSTRDVKDKVSVKEVWYLPLELPSSIEYQFPYLLTYVSFYYSQKSLAIFTLEHIYNAQHKLMVKPAKREMAAAPGEFIALQTCNVVEKIFRIWEKF